MNTIVDRFQNAMLKDHVEPERAGTTRGDPIGFSHLKKAAALRVALTRKEKKQIAAGLAISYAGLRKWETEEAFKALMHHYERDFGPFAVVAILDREIEPLEWEPLSAGAKFSLHAALTKKLKGVDLNTRENVTRRLQALVANGIIEPVRENKRITKREKKNSYLEHEILMLKLEGERPPDNPVIDILDELRGGLYDYVESCLETPEAKEALRTLRETEPPRSTPGKSRKGAA